VSDKQPSIPLTDTVTPDDQSAVADAICRAEASGAPVYPTGGRTSLGYGVWPIEPGVELSLTRLNRIIDHQARDLTVTVEAGVTMAQLRKHLATHRQRLPVDVPSMDRATVGGVVAICPAGPRQFQSGSIRDYVIGLSAVDGLGRPFSGGGRVVKNAAGYDLCRLLTGSLGTLGVITQVTLTVKPMPETSAMVACEVADLGVAEELLSQLVHTPTLPAAVELLVGPAWEKDFATSPMSASAIGRLLVAFEGDRADVDWMVGRLVDDWRASGGSKSEVIEKKRVGIQWKRLTEFAGESFVDSASAVVVQIRVLPGSLTDCVRLLLEIDPECSVQAHAGDGIVVARFSLPPEQLADPLAKQVRPYLVGAGGTMVVLSCPGQCGWDREMIWGPPSAAMKVMRAIRNQFDPKGILNRDRYVF
jgi:glycolate dehydrogenase FAD-binding subunit